MDRPRFVLGLLACRGRSEMSEALVGDVLEELAGGRSTWWVCRQILGLYGIAFAAYARRSARLTLPVIALLLGTVLLGRVSIASLGRVLVGWLGFYYVAGTVSLFAHMMSTGPWTRS
jgi:hypothetical protein